MMPGTRERSMPLVPEPFDHTGPTWYTAVSCHGITAEKWCKFIPNLNTRQYTESLSEAKKIELGQRCEQLFKRAIRNHLFQSSEFRWEACAWRDVFNLMLDHESLQMDKRPYEFAVSTDTDVAEIKVCIPDATLGLRTYDNYDLERGFICEVTGCTVDHSTQKPDGRLSKVDLSAMMHNSECGLVVDGLWGETNLVFPFAVYEAKKEYESLETAQEQVFDACRTYLAMLDDLARNPDNVAEYQTKESRRHQMFAFVSCGSFWQVFIVWNLSGDCAVETLWEGDVKQSRRAYDLICIVDQIQDYATHHHRQFVMEHLEAWHARHRRTSTLLPAEFTSLSDESDSCDSVESDTNMSSLTAWDRVINDCETIPKKLPEWLKLKERSKLLRQRRSAETRRRNRNLRELSAVEQMRKKPEKKRGRDRPPKSGITKPAEIARDKTPKRGRGRPKKSHY